MKDNLRAALGELSTSANPAGVRSALARSAILDSSAALRSALPPGCWPRAFQACAVAFGHVTRDVCLIADEMGLGKTPVALCRMVAGGHTPTVVICTASMLLKWEQEARKWAPGFPAVVLGTAADVAPPPGFRGVVITTWDLLKYRHVLALRRLRPRLVVFDEAHLMKNPETARYRAALALRQVAPHAILLTGTPILNTAAELWQLLHFLDPDAWPELTRSAFEEIDGEDLDRTDLRGRRAVLIARVRTFMVRRLKVQVGDEVPDKLFQDIEVELSPEDRARYTRVDTAFRTWLERHLTAKVAAERAALGRLPTSADLARIAERVEASVKREYFTKIGHLRRVVGPAKVPAALAWISQMALAREPVVVFFEHQTVHRLIQEGLDQRGIAYVSVVGDTSKAERARAAEAFQARRVLVLLASSAAREGITLTASCNLLRVERWWNPATEAQADDRIHRLSQTRNVRIWRLVARDTIDDRMGEINEHKKRIIERVVG